MASSRLLMDMRPRVHPRVEDSDNADRRIEHSIKDDVLARPMTVQTRRNVVPNSAKLGVHQEITHGIGHAPSVKILLLLSPRGEGVIEERLKIGLRFLREFELTG